MMIMLKHNQHYLMNSVTAAKLNLMLIVKGSRAQLKQILITMVTKM